MVGSDIILVSGHWPLNTSFAINTKRTIEYYCLLHNYKFYYDDVPPLEFGVHHLHYRRCEILNRAAIKYPDARWFVWLDTDIFVNRMEFRIESVIDLSDTNILYHLFYERPEEKYPKVWNFKYDIIGSHNINSGVKFVNRDAIKIESDIWDLRNDDKWKKFPYEQRVMVEKIIPENFDRIIIHPPYILNCIDLFYPVQDALFVHLCGRSEKFRNTYMAELLDRGLNDKQLLTLDEHKKIALKIRN